MDERQLTPEQENALDECGRKWLSIGLSSEPINREEIIGAVNDYYTEILGKSYTVPIVFCKGPFEAWACATLHFVTEYGLGKTKGIASGFTKNVNAEQFNAISSGINWRDQDYMQGRFDDRLRRFERLQSTIIDNVYNTNVRGVFVDSNEPAWSRSIKLTAREVIKKMVEVGMPVIGDHLKWKFPFEEMSEPLSKYFQNVPMYFDAFGQFKIRRNLMYEGSEIIGVTRNQFDQQKRYYKAKWKVDSYKEIFSILDRLTKCGDIFPFTKLCLVTERPTVFTVNGDNALHNTKGPAVLYADGTNVWALNGIEMPSWIITTPAEKINPKKLYEIRNVDIRRELVAKVGIERVCNELNARVIDQGHDQKGLPCELLMLDIGDDTRRPYIKLRNASVPGIYHIEGVHPDCHTLEEAFRYRNGTDEIPEQLT